MSERNRRAQVSPADPSTWPDPLKVQWILWDRGLRQRDLARAINTTDNVVSRILNGIQEPSSALKRRLRRWSKGFAYAEPSEVANDLVQNDGQGHEFSSVSSGERGVA